MARRAHGQSGSVDGNVPTKNGGETSKSGNETRTNTKSTEPSKILSLNAQGLIKTDTKWKVEMIKEYVHENNIILMNFTETWLKKEIQDEKIPNFTTFRADRKGGKLRGGGAAIYLRDGLEAQVLAEEYVDSCEMIAIFIEKNQCYKYSNIQTSGHKSNNLYTHAEKGGKNNDGYEKARTYSNYHRRLQFSIH